MIKKMIDKAIAKMSIGQKLDFIDNNLNDGLNIIKKEVRNMSSDEKKRTKEILSKMHEAINEIEKDCA